MQIRLGISIITLVLTFNLFVSSLQAETDIIEAKHIRGSVYMLRSNTNLGNPTSVAYISPHGTFLADANFSTVSEPLDAKLKELGSQNLSYVICTHHHGDHSEGIEYFYKQATIISPTMQREYLKNNNIVKGERPIIAEALPTITFDDKLDIYLGDETMNLFTPSTKSAHTGGDAFIYFKNANILYIGDHLFLNKFPIIDIDDGGSIDGVFQNLEKILKDYNDDIIIIPGHGTFPPNEIAYATKADVRRNIDNLKESIEIVQNKMKNGKTLEQIQKEGLPEKFDSYNAKPRYVNSDRWIKFIYENYHN